MSFVLPYTFAAGTPILSAQVNANFSALVAALSGGAFGVRQVYMAEDTITETDNIVSYAAGENIAVTIPDAASFTPAIPILILADVLGVSGQYPITVTPVSGNIGGAPSRTINSPYGVLRLYSDGTRWVAW